MTEKLNINFVKKLQRDVEPKINPGETALEAIKRMEAERVASMIQNPTPTTPPPTPPQEVVFFEGYKLPRDFFTYVAVCIMKSRDPEIAKIRDAFGFNMKDIDGKPIVFTKSQRTRSRGARGPWKSKSKKK